MIAVFLQKLSEWWQYAVVFVAFIVLQAFCFSLLLPLPVLYIVADAVVYACTYLLLGLMLWSTLRYGQFNTQPFMQVVLIYVALITLSVVVSYAVGYGFYQLLPLIEADVLFTFMPVRLFVSLLVTVLLIQYNHFRICRIIHSTDAQNRTDEAEELIPVTEQQETATTVELLERISVKSGTKIHVIPVADVVCLQADGDYVQIHTMSGKYLKEQTMKYFEENLPPTQFLRVHRSCIVNVQCIARIELYDKQSQQLTLKNGQQIKVSQAGYKLLRSKLKL